MIMMEATDSSVILPIYPSEYTIVSLRTVVFKHSRLHDCIESHGRLTAPGSS